MFALKPGQIRPTGSTVIYFDPTAIETSPYQARESYPDLDELAESILSEGQQIPIRLWLTATSLDNGATITDGNKYYIAYCHDGNRRLRAFRLALEKDPNNVMIAKGIKAIIIPEISSETEALISQYTLNNTGRAFDPLEEAMICKKLSKAGFNNSEIASKLGKSPVWVGDTLKLLTYSDEVKQMIRDGQLSASLAISQLKKTDDKQELENTLVEAAKVHGKVTKSKLTGVDNRGKKAKIKPTEVSPDNVNRLTLQQAITMLIDQSHSITSVSEHELGITVPKVLFGRIQDILAGDDD